MISTTLIRIALTVLLVCIINVGLYAACVEPAANCALPDSGVATASIHNRELRSCSPAFSPRINMSLGDLRGQFFICRGGDSADSIDPAAICVDASLFVVRIDWTVGDSTILSIQI